MSQTDPSQPEDTPAFLLGPRDRAIVDSAISLLKKVINAPFTTSPQLLSLAKALQALAALPAVPTLDQPLRVSLSGPDRQFGEHIISHWWTIELVEQSINISSGGSFYRPSTGGDNFTSLQWYAQPDSEPDCSICLETLQIVDDAKPFPEEVAALDLAEPGFALDIEDEANPSLAEPDEEPAQDESRELTTEETIEDLADKGITGIDEAVKGLHALFGGARVPAKGAPTRLGQKLSAAEERLAKLADEAEGLIQGQTYANPSDNCDFCGCSLARRAFFVDARLRGQIMFACLCAECFFEKAEGIGWGKGQLYQRQPDGAWLMVAGFKPEGPEQ